MPPPERIELADVGATLRRYTRDDLDVLHTAIEESRDHLRPFMPWADGTRADTSDFLTAAIDNWNAGTEFNYGIFDATATCSAAAASTPGSARRARDRLLAACRRHWPGHRHRRGAGADRRRVRPPGVDRVEIHCDEANVRSAAVPAASATGSIASRTIRSRRPATSAGP